jgi:ferritin-like metal-binding protein YciE
MPDAHQKVLQYLEEAHATESALVQDLGAQIAMTSRGSYRSLLEKHLRETRDHAERLTTRMNELGRSSNPLQIVGGFAQDVVGQMLAVGRAPFVLVRGNGGDEKVLKNAKDACAAEALEIATYIAIEKLATEVGDDDTAKLAASIRADEERMLKALHEQLPKLTAAMVRAELRDDPTYDLTKTGAADAVKEAADEVKETTRNVAGAAKRTTRQARKVPGVARAEGEIKGAVATQQDLAISGYDDRTADEITAKLPELSQIEIAKIDAYERRTENRTTVLGRISSLRAEEPWPGYDELTVAEIDEALRAADSDLVAKVRTYERAHKGRKSVLQATDSKATATA